MKRDLHKRFPSALAMLIAAIAWTLSPMASAQNTTGTEAMPAASEVTDEQVDAYVNARTRVEEIKAKYNARLDGSESAADMEDLQDSANTEMSVAVTTAGLSIEKYNEIALAVQSDPTLRERVKKAMSG